MESFDICPDAKCAYSANISIYASEDSLDEAIRAGTSQKGLIRHDTSDLDLNLFPEGSLRYLKGKNIRGNVELTETVNIHVSYPVTGGAVNQSLKAKWSQEFLVFSEKKEWLDKHIDEKVAECIEALNHLSTCIADLYLQSDPSSDFRECKLSSLDLKAVRAMWEPVAGLKKPFKCDTGVFQYSAYPAIFTFTQKVNDAFLAVDKVSFANELRKQLSDLVHLLETVPFEFRDDLPSSIPEALRRLSENRQFIEEIVLVYQSEQELAREEAENIKNNFIEKYGSEHLKLGVELKKNMNQLFREEYARFTYENLITPVMPQGGKLYIDLDNKWRTRDRINPELVELQCLKQLKTYTNLNVDLRFVNDKEAPVGGSVIVCSLDKSYLPTLYIKINNEQANSHQELS